MTSSSKNYPTRTKVKHGETNWMDCARPDMENR